MIERPPFLTVPISARISADGRLISADPPIWRLHFLAGGTADGLVAIPGLASLAALAMRTKMRLERPIRAVDEENDVELWVHATADTDATDIAIVGWRDIVAVSEGFLRDVDVTRDEQDNAAILIDRDLRLVQIPSALPDAVIGQHLGSLFILKGDDNGGIPLVDALTERRPVDGETVGLVGQDRSYSLRLKPEFAANGDYLGHSGQLLPISPDPIDAMPAGDSDALPMGRQFASVLKQPLSRIVANADTISSRMHGPLRGNYAEYARDIANAARHLSELVSDMEDLEAIDRPDFSVARDKIELGDIARRVAGLLALKASDHGIRLEIPAVSERAEAIGEFRRVLQIALNLVGNAIRYAPDGSTVVISIDKQASIASFSVADEGNGISKVDRDRVFEKFERLGRSGDGGSGLGLYISRRLARAMNGDLTVTDASGGGALFRLTLPAR